MKFARLFGFALCLLLNGSCAVLSPPAATDADLKAKITGVWFSEVLPDINTHIGGRYQYYPDGRFVADYRISQIGNEEYRRAIGTWKVSGGIFTETARESNSPNGIAPRLDRNVVAISSRQMELKAAHGSARAVLYKSRAPLSPGIATLRSFDKGEYLQAAQDVGIRGFIPVPAKGQRGYFSWRLESRELERLR